MSVCSVSMNVRSSSIFVVIPFMFICSIDRFASGVFVVCGVCLVCVCLVCVGAASGGGGGGEGGWGWCFVQVHVLLYCLSFICEHFMCVQCCSVCLLHRIDICLLVIGLLHSVQVHGPGFLSTSPERVSKAGHHSGF